MKRILILSMITTICFWSCDDKVGNPQITFENGVDSIAEVFPGDLFYVKGKISSEDHISQAFYFHQKKDENGKIDEVGDMFELDKSGDGSFSLSFIAEPTTIGVKVIAQDTKGNRLVKVFKVIQGVDGIDITIEEPGFVEEIDSGETFTIKGKIESKTKITSFTYQVAKGDVLDNPINVLVTNDLEHLFELPIVARNGMTGIILKAMNKGELTATKLFELKHVTAVGPIILFDNNMREVKPDSTFAVTGRISSNDPIETSTYTILRGSQSDSPVPFVLDDNRFDININVGEDVTGGAITATDTKENESMQTMVVSILFPSMTEGSVMRHYKNIILTDEHFDKSYFSFSVAPYVLNDVQAKANQDKVDLLYNNVFISPDHANNGPALFAPNVAQGGTIHGHALVEGWDTPFNVTRLPIINDFLSTLGKDFDEVTDNAEEWDYIDAFLKSKMGNSGVLRQIQKVAVGQIFGIGFGGKATDRSDMDKYAVAIVRGFGGEAATSRDEPTGAWIELEIKIRK